MTDTPAITDDELRALMARELPAGLLAHIDRVVALADTLARRHHLDVARVRLAAQGHDLLRAVPEPELLSRAEARGMAIDPVERGAPILLHGPLGALELAERFGVRDERVLAAVRWHTTGHPAFDAEAWAVFVADKVEPRKVQRWPALAAVAALGERSLETAARRYLDLRLEEAVARGLAVHPLATLARNALLRRPTAAGPGAP